MKKTNAYKVETYEHGDYLVEIVTTSTGELEAWLRHKSVGIAVFMFGTGSACGDFLEIVEDSLYDDIRAYEEQYAPSFPA